LKLFEILKNTGFDRVWTDGRFGKETVGEFISRHDIPINSDGTVTLYHARPKNLNFGVLRNGSYLTADKNAAVFFAARDRNLKPKDIEVLTLRLSPDQIQPGVHITLIGDYKL
jgi:hypothetical protein